MRKRPQRRKEHRGPLYWQSITSAIPSKLLVPSPRNDDDPHGFGWRIADSPPRTKLAFKRLLYATAEGAVGLAAILEAVRRSNGFSDLLEADFDETAPDLVDALKLSQVATGIWAPPEHVWTYVRGCYTYPLTRFEISKADEVEEIAGWIAEAALRVPKGALQGLESKHEDLHLCLKRTISEAVLNIWEHAYPANGRKPAQRLMYACLTVAPPSHYLRNQKSRARPGQTPNWFEENREGLVFEIALADIGVGIPRTLWRDAERRKLPFTQSTSWKDLTDETRAECHRFLCQYAFDHQSTCKTPDQFLNRAARLSWRGWHRAMKLAAYLGGRIFVASGRGRAGYSFSNRVMHSVSPRPLAHMDFPGTMAVLQFSTADKPVRTTPVTVPNKTGMLGVHDTVWEESVLANIPPNRNRDDVHEHSPHKSKEPLGILFPLRGIGQTGELIELLRAVSPDRIPVLLFCKLAPPILPELRAIAEKWNDTRHGMPRLLAFWSPEEDVFRWKIAGELPVTSTADRFYSDLEEQGQADLTGESSAVWEVARELSRLFPSLLQFDKDAKQIRFVRFEEHVPYIVYSEQLNKVFARCWTDGLMEKAVYHAPAGKVIRLPSGRYVRKALSVLNLLWANTLLVDALRYKMKRLLAETSDPSQLCIVVDSPASYFVACLILRKHPSAPPVFICGQHPAELKDRKVVVFVDILSRIHTVKKVLSRLESEGVFPSRIISCLDVRRTAFNLLLDRESPLTPMEGLLTLDFDPEQLDARPSPDDIIEWDAITHTPTSSQSEFTGLASTEEAIAFLEKHKELYRHGLHVVEGRLHTISFHNDLLVRNHSLPLAQWLSTKIIDMVARIGVKSREAVLFCRPESAVVSLLTHIATELRSGLPFLRRVWIANVPAAPTRPKSLFPRGQINLVKDLVLCGDPELLTPDPLRDGFLGIYLDDGATPGDTLFDFISKASSLPTPRPCALVTLLVVNQLSPRETRLLLGCKAFSGFADGAMQAAHRIKEMPFRFDYLFCLQVRSLDLDAFTSVHQALRTMSENSLFYDEDIKNYIEALQNKLENASREGMVISHPYHPDSANDQDPISTRSVHLRHLLALNQQNEGVMGAILREIELVKELHDYTILSVLALEPQLLRDDPLAAECWRAIRDLAVEAIVSNCDTPLKSDALIVLGSEPNELLGSLSVTLLPLLRDRHLAILLCVLLVSFCQRDQESHNKIQATLDDVREPIVKDQCGWIRETVAAVHVIRSKYSIHTGESALAQLHSLVAKTGWHVGLESWVNYDRRVKSINDSQPLAVSADFVDQANECLSLAEDTLIPSLSALRGIARQRRDGVGADQLGEAMRKSVVACQRIRRLLREGGDGREMKMAWRDLRGFTLAAASPDRFLGRVEKITETPPTLERLMPKYFCAPYKLFCYRQGLVLPGLRIIVEDEAFENAVVIVPVDRDLMDQVFKLLLYNIRDHADLRTALVRFCLPRSGGTGDLEIQIEDKVRANDRKGLHSGMPYVQAIAHSQEFRVSVDEASAPGDPYGLRMKFSQMLVVHPPVVRR